MTSWVQKKQKKTSFSVLLIKSIFRESTMKQKKETVKDTWREKKYIFCSACFSNSQKYVLLCFFTRA